MISTSRKQRIRISIVLVLLLLCVASIVGMAQFRHPEGKEGIRDIASLAEKDSARLANEFGKNKELAPGYEKQILYALSYFPELKDTRIKFVLESSAGGIIATHPTVGSILRRGDKRTYIVTISQPETGRSLPLFKNAPFNGQVGIVGHELCHIIYFSNCTGMGLIGLGVAHVSKKFLDRWEYTTDSMDIERGLGYQLLDWKSYLDVKFRAMWKDLPTNEKPPGDNRYMSVEQIQRAMDRSKLYAR